MSRRARAFTLIEMLVVLVILAVVTAVALRSTPRSKNLRTTSSVTAPSSSV